MYGNVSFTVFGPKGHLENKLVLEGLQKISDKFQSIDHIGPKHAADFEATEDRDESVMKMRDAFERVAYLLRRLEIRE
jgi:hypothetical protein